MERRETESGRDSGQTDRLNQPKMAGRTARRAIAEPRPRKEVIFVGHQLFPRANSVAGSEHGATWLSCGAALKSGRAASYWTGDRTIAELRAERWELLKNAEAIVRRLEKLHAELPPARGGPSGRGDARTARMLVALVRRINRAWDTRAPGHVDG
jgi:hypothetical protein